MRHRARTGATVIGQWSGGEFEPHPRPAQRLDVGAILLAIGSDQAVAELGRLATPLTGRGPVIVCGFGSGASGLAGQSLGETRSGSQTWVSVVGVDRSGAVLVGFDEDFRVRDTDVLTVCGTEDAIRRLCEVFPDAKL